MPTPLPRNKSGVTAPPFVNGGADSRRRIGVVFADSGILVYNKNMPTRVLLVEDEPILVSLYSLALSKAGYEVATALDSATGVEKVLMVRPHLVLLDLLIPADVGGEIQTDDFHEPIGFQILRLVKGTPALDDIRVMVLSNLDSDEHIKKAQELGADDYIVKAGLDPHDLHTRVEQVLHKTKGKISKSK